VKAKKTMMIGLTVTLIAVIQIVFDFSPVRFITLGIGLFFIVFGWKIGWVFNRNFTAAIGHIAVVAGCFVLAFGIYQLPGMTEAPGILEVLDLPIFWGMIALWGGQCMIKHSYCNCVIRMHKMNNGL
jgi:hypothetical protein